MFDVLANDIDAITHRMVEAAQSGISRLILDPHQRVQFRARIRQIVADRYEEELYATKCAERES